MIKIKDYKIGDEIEISELIQRVYNEFVAHDYSDEGNKFFHNFIVPENFIDRYVKKGNIILIAEVNNMKAGMIEVRDNNQVSLMFVDKAYQRKGTARKLLNEAIKQCKERDKGLNCFYVHASPFSIPIYEKLGFKKTDEVQEQIGIKYLPMKMNIV